MKRGQDDKCRPLFHRWRRSLHMPGLKRCSRCGWYRRADEMGAGTIVSWYRPGTFGGDS
jgi:hypothetical protein